MNKHFQFKKWIFLLNVSLTLVCASLVVILFPSVVKDLTSIEQFSDLYLPLFWVAIVWQTICEFGYNALLFLPKGIALELNEDSIRVCSPFGMKKIPRTAVLGCKSSVHRMTQGKNSGRVIISVSPKYRVPGPYGVKVNPQFHGASVVGENEQTIVKKIREWRKLK